MPGRGPNERETRVLEGIGVSPGYAIGRAHLVDRRRVRVPKYHLSAGQVKAELQRFAEALAQSESQIQDIKGKLVSAGEEQVLILEAHQLMMRDEMLVEGTRQLIREQNINAEWALKKVVRSIKQIFDNIDDEYFRERRSDVDFVGDRILRNLLGGAHPSLSQVGHSAIVVAHDLSPADTAFLMRTAVLGFATDVGGKTSHTAIMARSLELPAVVGLERITEIVGTGDVLVLDGTLGRVLVNPPPDEVKRYQRQQMVYSAHRAKLDEARHEPSTTQDGTPVRIAGNIELPEETSVVLEYGAEGVGLYRTEYLYMNRETLPDEQEQYEHYRQVLETAGAAGATIRTLDLGGDKFIEPLKLNRELNPVMGLRAIRFCLREQGIFRTQLRALLRASVHGNLRMMLPLISSIEEVWQTRAILDECRQQLEQEGQPMADHIPLGIMIELPSAAAIADLLAKEVDFFAIGTNDLIQYTLAIDRANEHVAHLYRPLHPALLRMLEFIVASANAAGIRVSMCGEMAGEALFVPVLLGLGLRELSMNTVSIPIIKSVVRAVSIDTCEDLFRGVRDLVCADQIEARVRAAVDEMLAGTDAAQVVNPGLPPEATPG
ncbi:MAG: phosphoenolpyruvate--protein phosphotransferase [Myxococcales bacterium]|nr:phosphoenolpyruvate--protein phosphotransferase [Myxococcales bacterium]